MAPQTGHDPSAPRMGSSDANGNSAALLKIAIRAGTRFGCRCGRLIQAAEASGRHDAGFPDHEL
jgi:hypothetical protein